jgi:hypothetical protein
MVWLDDRYVQHGVIKSKSHCVSDRLMVSLRIDPLCNQPINLEWKYVYTLFGAAGSNAAQGTVSVFDRTTEW